MNKIPGSVYFAFALAFLLVGVLAAGFIYDAYFAPIDCRASSLDSCPKRCAICPSCAACNDLSCQNIETCKASGTYDAQFEQIRNGQSLDTPKDQVGRLYEPALQKFDAYDHLDIVECGQTLCVKIFLKKDSAELKSSMPDQIDGMKVVYEVVGSADEPAAQKCGIENCHGLDIACGSNVPDACTEIYMAGDGCRRYAKCEIAGGACLQSVSPVFDACKTCVQKCETDFSSDSPKIFECEAECIR